MRLPEIQLDDRRFQDLVNEARLRITRTCPEWTEHNVSDPGITLIELFAWMTEMTIYRLNRVPDKLHVQLLELLGVKLDPPAAASTQVRFRLADLPTEPMDIPLGETEIATPRVPGEDPVIFQTSEAFTIPVVQPATYAIQRSGQIKDIGVAGGVAKPIGADRPCFGEPPELGDAFYLGFEEPIARLMLQLQVDASQARGAGVDPEDPPLIWEVSQGDNEWLSCDVLEDRTGGFNYGSGQVELQMPARSAIQPIAGHRFHWLRCRVSDTTRNGQQATNTYQAPPEIYSIAAGAGGALLPVSHSSRIVQEIAGVSDGTPGQVFTLRNTPVLKTGATEILEVQEPGSSQWHPWELRDSFEDSGPDDHHYTLDLVSGEIELGPAVRQSDGGWRQYGAVPEKGCVLRFSAYRHGGGLRGNVAPGALSVLKTSIPGVASVSNPAAARGGVDPESLDSARQRAALEIRTRYRAVTAEDFEFLCGEASPRVARAVCVPPQDGGPVAVRILPRVAPADRMLEYDELVPQEELLSEVAEYLDQRRVIGTSIQLLPVRFRGLSVVVNLQASPLADTARVEEEVAQALYTFINPLIGGSPTGPGPGWAFGRALNQGELFGVVHAVEGVEYVKILRIYETNLQTGEQSPKPAGSHIVLEPDEVLASGQHIVKATHRE